MAHFWGAKKEDLTNKNIPVGLEFEGRGYPLIVSQLLGCLGIITKILQINLRSKIMSTFLKILIYFDNEISDYEPIII